MNTKENFNILVSKLELNNKKMLEGIQYNPYTVELETNTVNLLKDKVEKCNKFFRRIKTISEGQVEIDQSTLTVKAKPKEGYREDYDRVNKLYSNCMTRINKVYYPHQLNIYQMHKFVDEGKNNCLKNNCLTLHLNQAPEQEVVSCIKDCLHFELVNTKALINLLNDEYLKYSYDLNKIYV